MSNPVQQASWHHKKPTQQEVNGTEPSR